MRCRVCDYRLWNLTARQCPECGTPFRPSEYDFVPSSVEFRCPHCGQDYYGTGPRGHLEPAAFDCVSCGKPVTMDEMVLRPAESVEEEQTEVFRLPWLDRQATGWFRAWWSTVKLALFSPTKLMRGLPPVSGVGDAFWFAVSTYLFMIAVGAAIFTLIGLVDGMSTGATLADAVLIPVLAMAGYALGLLVVLVVTAAVAHGVLWITGGTAHGFGRTLEALCYASGVSVLILTGCGAYIYWIWWLVSAALMLREGQRVHGARATLSLLALPILWVVGGVLYLTILQPAAPTPVPGPTTVPAPAPAPQSGLPPV